MRTPILIVALTFGLAILFSSCTISGKFVTVSSEDTKQTENKEFVIETDSLRILYNFNGMLGSVQIVVYNKLNEGLIIDWRKSALILGDSPIVYFSPALRVNGNIKTSLIQTDPTERASTFSATVKREESREFIPPQSKIVQTGYYVAQNGLNTKSVEFTEEQLEIQGLASKYRIKKASFTKSNSPLIFRSYLTFISGNNETGIFSVSNSFYVSEVLQFSGEYNFIANKLGYTGPYYER